MSSNTLNAGLKKESQIFLSSSLETRATRKVNFGDVELFTQNHFWLHNDYFEELDTIPNVAKGSLQNGKNKNLKKGTKFNELFYQKLIDTYFSISKRVQGDSPANRGLAPLARF